MRNRTIQLLTFTLLLFISCSKEETRTWYWCDLREQGDTNFIVFRFGTSTGMKIGDGVVIPNQPKRLFYGYDTSIVQLNKMCVIPKNVGSTIIYVRHPNPDSTRIVETLHLTVKNVKGKLVLKRISPA